MKTARGFNVRASTHREKMDWLAVRRGEWDRVPTDCSFGALSESDRGMLSSLADRMRRAGLYSQRTNP